MFASRAEKAREKDERLMAAFAGSRLQAGQDEVDAPIDSFVDAPGSVKGYEDAPAALMGGLR